MKYVFRHSAELQRRLRPLESTLWIFDFDGTLAPIAAHPKRSLMSLQIRRGLQSLVRLHPGRVGILSGRTLSQLRRKVGLRGLIYGAVHGFEIQGPGFHFHRRVPPGRWKKMKHWERQACPMVGKVRGAWIEKKKWSCSVHYREVHRSHRKRMAGILRGLRASAAKLGFPAQQGIKALEIFAAPGWGKGEAVRWLLRRLGAAKVFYVGDDTTDESVFRSLDKRHATIRIRRKRDSDAAFYMKTQSEMARLLQQIRSL